MRAVDVQDATVEIAARWRSERDERFRRTELSLDDFADLRAAGLTTLAVPESHGGGWRGAPSSQRAVCEALRVLAAGDPSPALVSAMHPAVLGFFLANESAGDEVWSEQCAAVFAVTAAGAQWGTVTSEPGSGGDVSRTRAAAAPIADGDDGDDIGVPGRRYAITGDKHFGSGTGVCSFMFTTAVPAGKEEPAAFFLDTRALIEGSELPGFTITSAWDGVGMRATQSHAVRLDGCRGVRLEWPGSLDELAKGASPLNTSAFTAVVLGVLDEAMAVAGERIRPRVAELRSYEQVEWARATTDHWLAQQAYDGMLRTIEGGDLVAARVAGLRCKTAVAEIAETTLQRIGRIVGGGTFSSSSPFSAWFEDVRALGFLRPPWGLAYDGLIAASAM